MPVMKADKQAVLAAAAIIYNGKVERAMQQVSGRSITVAELAAESAAEATVLVYAVEKHMAPKDRRPGR